MISVITPFHKQDTTYLKEAYQSLKCQSVNWQWVLVPNNEGLSADLSEFKDKRIKIVPFNEITNSIGKIKNFAFKQGDGEWLVELDSDDILAPNALEELSKVKEDFAYSNTADFKPDYESPKYNPAYGWKYREVEFKGHTLNEAISWKPTPASISLIFYAPNHFRAWRKDFYNKIGGHNKDFEIADDHELLIRTYLQGTMKHIDKCLYFYRIHGDNNWLTRNAKIQELTHQLYYNNIHKLCERWCDLKGLRKIDLGGRFNRPDGYESVDIKDADVIMDLKEKWKFKDGEVGLIRANDILEHLPDKQHTMEEIHRVLASGGYLLSSTPSALGEGAWQDPTHCSQWVRNSFYYYTRKEQAKYIDNDKIKFQVMKLENYFPNDWAKQNNILYVRADLIKVGSERLPGLLEI